MQIVFYKFTKRPNSTKKPAADDSTRFVFTGARLKENCSFVNPVLLIPPELTSGGVTVTFSPVMYNYCWVATWQRYYFVQDWTYLNSVWECRLVPDPLATFKSEIGDTSAYVLRSASSYSSHIIDSFYPATSLLRVENQTIESEIYQTSFADGCFILGVVNAEDTSAYRHPIQRIGSVMYYALNNTNMNRLMAYLFSGNLYDDTGLDIEEISEGLYKTLFDPFQYIVSCVWFPLPITVPAGKPGGENPVTKTVKVGYWDISGCVGYPVAVPVKEFGFHSTMPIGHHPQADGTIATRGYYLDKAPYTRLTLYYPPFGEIPIDTNFYRFYDDPDTSWTETNYIYGTIYLDFITGNADLRYTITDGYDITQTGHAAPDLYMGQRSAMLGIPIQLSKISTDYVSMANNAVGGVSSLLTGNISGVFSNLISGVANSFPKTASLGSNGSFLTLIEPPTLIKEYHLLVDEDIQEFGRPLCKVKTLSSLSGYIKCADDDHAFSGTSEENRIINEHLKNGFFYE